MAQTLDYQKVAAFWKNSTEKAKEKLDYVAGQDRMIPVSVQARLRDAQMQFFRREVLPSINKSTRVLDLGCGPGVWALELAPQVGHVTGIDIAPAFIEHANAEAQRAGIQNARFEVASFLDYTPQEQFDLILLGAMLVHVDDPELLPLLSKVRGSLRPGGLVYVRSSLAPRRRYARTGTYQALYRTREEYERAFKAAGFTFHQERDVAYTDASLAAVYFGAANVATLGLARRFESVGMRLYEWLEANRPLALDGARVLLDKTPTPISYHFVLRAIE
jgi:2-polyprenyl-3-methyl-5-hydroxy-6-metoxy-1,4-benzoquinol methylase